MKKVLFYFNNYCSESSRGGTEVATFRIAKALKDSGECEVFHAYHNNHGNFSEDIYTDTVKISKTKTQLIDTLSKFIMENEIDNVVVMSRFFKFDKIKKAVEKSGRKTTLIFMQHFAPGSEKKKTTFSASWHLLKLNPRRTKYYLRTLFYPILKLPRTLRWSRKYRKVYENGDKIVLLSKGYFKDFCKTGKFSDDKKFVAIPNIYESPKNLDKLSSLALKEKRVLILSRMDEIQKRISLALKIWKKIEDDPDLADWHLDIVGTGNNTDIVKRLLKKYKFQNVTYHGWQNREPFLQKSSILMLTSEYEGLPLSILEAQTYGCVPIAFNSFASLKDVIEPFTNGVIVEKFGDIDDYVKKLTELMYDKTYREELSKNSKIGINNFSSENIARQWLKILI